MNMKKLMAGVVAGALALSTLAVSAFADGNVKIAYDAGSTTAYTHSATFGVETTKVSLAIGDTVTASKSVGDTIQLQNGWMNLVIESIQINGVDAKDGVVTAGLSNSSKNNTIAAGDFTKFTVTYTGTITDQDGSWITPEWFNDNPFDVEAGDITVTQGAENATVSLNGTLEKMVRSEKTTNATYTGTTTFTLGTQADSSTNHKVTVAEKAALAKAKSATLKVTFADNTKVKLGYVHVATDLLGTVGDPNKSTAATAVVMDKAADVTLTLPVEAVYDPVYGVMLGSIDVQLDVGADAAASAVELVVVYDDGNNQPTSSDTSDTQVSEDDPTNTSASDTQAPASSDDNGNTNAGTGDDKNQPTGVALAVIPAIVAAAGVVIAKKRG